MKLGILGVGKIVDMIMPFYTSLGIEKTYFLSTDRSFSKAQTLIQTYGFDGVYKDYQLMLKEADIDTVYIALPNHLHYQYAKQAIMAGKHVICEKPISVTIGEYDQLKSYAQQKGVYLLEAMMLHYMPIIEKLKQSLNQLGSLKLATLHFTQYSSRYRPVSQPDRQSAGRRFRGAHQPPERRGALRRADGRDPQKTVL